MERSTGTFSTARATVWLLLALVCFMAATGRVQAQTSAAVSSLVISPGTVVGGTSATGTITLTTAAPIGGAACAMGSSNGNIAQCALTVTVPAGQTSTTFSITTFGVGVNQPIEFTATAGGQTQSAELVVAPVTAGEMGGLQVSASTVVGPSGATGTISLYATSSSPTTVYMGTSNAAVGQCPQTVTVPANQSSATFPITTFNVGTPQAVTFYASATGGTASATVTVAPASGPSVSSIAVAPYWVTTTGGATGTVTLNAAAPSGGATVWLSCGSSFAQLPATVAVPAGQTSATFAIATYSVPSSQFVTVAAAAAGVTQSTQFGIVCASGPSVSGLQISPSMVIGTSGAAGIISLSSAAPSGGLTVDMTSSNGAVAACATQIIVPAGQTSANFPITTYSLTAAQPVTFTATGGNWTSAASVTVQPVTAPSVLNFQIAPSTVNSGGIATGTVILNAPAVAGGTTVTIVNANSSLASAPASVVVPAGETTGEFTIAAGSIATAQSDTFTAAVGGASQPAVISIAGLPGPSVTAVQINPIFVVGGGTVTGTIYLSAAPPAGGLSVSLASSDPPVASCPLAVTVPAGQTFATFSAPTTAVAASQTVTILATASGITQARAFTVGPGSPPAVASLTATSSIYGGTSATGTVTLNTVAPSGGTTVALNSSQSSVATVPAAVTVASGQTSATFTVASSAVSSAQTVTITAATGSVSRTMNIFVLAPAVTSLTLSSYGIVGGSTTTGTITLTGVAPTGGTACSVGSSNGSVAACSQTVTVAAGQNTANFPIATFGVGTNQSVQFSATAGGETQSAEAVVTPSSSSIYLAAFRMSTSVVAGSAGATATLTLSSTSSSPTIVYMGSSNGNVAQCSVSVTIPANQSSVTFPVTTFNVGTAQPITFWASLNDGVLSTTLTVIPTSGPSVSSILGASYWVTTTGGTTATVTLNTAAPAGGTTVWLTSSSAYAQVPATVTIPAGQTSTTFTITTFNVPSTQYISISASAGGVTQSTEFGIVAAAGIDVAGLSIYPSVVVGADGADGTITLNTAAPTGGATVYMTSSNGGVASCASLIVVPAGQISTTFPISTYDPAAAQAVEFTATAGNGTQTAAVTVDPPVPFQLSASLVDISALEDGATSTVISLSQPPGQNDTVTLSCSGLPAGVTAAFSTASLSGSGTSTITLTAGATAVAATIPITVTGACGAITATTTLILTVVPNLLLTSIAVSPSPAFVVGGTTQQFAASGLDQFGNALAVQPNFTWSTNAGTIDSTGSYTAQTQAATGHYVAAASGTISGSSTVAVVPVSPFVTALSVSPTQAPGGSTVTVSIAISAPAPLGGATIYLWSSNPAVAPCPSYVSVPQNQTSMTFTIATATPTNVTTINIYAGADGESEEAVLTVMPAVYVSTLNVYPDSVAGLSSSVGTATLSQPALTGGYQFSLISSNPVMAQCPSSITVPAGGASATFPITTADPGFDTTVTFSASNFVGQNPALTVHAFQVANVAITPGSVNGTGYCMGTVTSNFPAPSAGLTVNLTSSSSLATVPSTVTIPPGQTAATFSVATTDPSVSTTVTISGTIAFQSVAASAILTVVPCFPAAVTLSPNVVYGGAAAYAQVTLNSAAVGGATVTVGYISGGAQCYSYLYFPTGASQEVFYYVTDDPSQDDDVLVTATAGGQTASADLVVMAFYITSLTLDPTSVVGGNTCTGTVSVNIPAPSGGFDANASTNSSPYASCKDALILAGSTSTTFSIITTDPPPNSPTAADISVSYDNGNATKSVSLQIFPSGVASLSIAPNGVLGGASCTATVTLTAPAPAGGMLVTLSSNNSAVASAPASITIPAGVLSGTFTVATNLPNANSVVTITATAGSNYQQAQLTVWSDYVTGLSITPGQVEGNYSGCTGTVTLVTAAPTGGTVVYLGSSDSSVASCVTSVAVPAGSTSQTFAIAIYNPTIVTPVTLTGFTLGQASAAFGVVVVSPQPEVQSVSFSPSLLVGGTASTATITLSAPAPSGGQPVTVSFGGPVSNSSMNVTVLGGQTTATITVNTQSVLVTELASVTAAANGTSVTNRLTVEPALYVISLGFFPSRLVPGGQTTGTITLNAPAPSGGCEVSLAIVSSSNGAGCTFQTSVDVPAASTTASFTATATSTSSNPGTVILSATTGGAQANSAITVGPVAVAGVWFEPSAVVAGTTTGLMVALNGPAPSGGLAVQINVTSGSISGLVLPSAINVPAGASIASSQVTTPSTVSTDATCQISASTSMGTVTSSLTVLSASAPDFYMTANPSTLDVLGGLTGTSTITFYPVDGFTGEIYVGLTSRLSGAWVVPSNVDITCGVPVTATLYFCSDSSAVAFPTVIGVPTSNVSRNVTVPIIPSP